MRATMVGLIGVSFLFTVGCTQPSGGGGSSPAPKPVTASPAQASPAAASPAAASPMAASPVAAGSGAPAASGAPAGGDTAGAVKKMQEDTGLVFVVPTDYKTEVKPDGELQGTLGENEFFALMPGETVDAVWDDTVSKLKKMGGDSYKPDGDAKSGEQAGVKGKMMVGKLDVQGKSMDFMLFVFDGGKKPLRLVAFGAGLKDSKSLQSLVDSVKK